MLVVGSLHKFGANHHCKSASDCFPLSTGANSECWWRWSKQSQVPHWLPPTPPRPWWVVEALPCSLSRPRPACLEQQCLHWRRLEEHWQDAPEPERGGSAESWPVWSWLSVSPSSDRFVQLYSYSYSLLFKCIMWRMWYNYIEELSLLSVCEVRCKL